MEVDCPNPKCRSGLKGPKRLIGELVRCPNCDHEFVWCDRFYSGRSFVIYDLETTGLSPERDEFIQIAAVRFEAGRLIPRQSFFSFAKPRSPISSYIESLTGIGNRHVRKAPYPEEVLCEFSRFAGSATLIAHNGKRFDGKFLEATCRRHRLPSRVVDCIDSIHLSKRMFGATRGTKHNMDEVLRRLRISAAGVRRHDARGDVELLGKALEKMWRELRLDEACNGIDRHQTLLPNR